ncbi:hypothetical protein BCR44DRAFT_1157969 [Catenaria anguillulae PL171]|uniref:Uncharacterized protein n=1 Tax=Catenaria anguillulae PL171 TaxID=765915 RepID=A0A1Y2HIM8_9FUNG|nr:hypothetical protein BCR44DRAFT_1157969 [Catenaria anguillulae PL171]
MTTFIASTRSSLLTCVLFTKPQSSSLNESRPALAVKQSTLDRFPLPRLLFHARPRPLPLGRHLRKFLHEKKKKKKNRMAFNLFHSRHSTVYPIRKIGSAPRYFASLPGTDHGFPPFRGANSISESNPPPPALTPGRDSNGRAFVARDDKPAVSTAPGAGAT